MSNTMTRLGWAAAAALALLTLAAAAGVARGGPLDPPGPPASTTSQIEPRRAISALPFTIDAGGSYYLTQSMSYGGGDAITIAANNVTLDLDGFTLSGVGVSAGVSVPSTERNITIKNGTIEGFSRGISADAAYSSHIAGVTIRYYGAADFAIRLGASSVLEDCIVDGIGSAGNGVLLANRTVMRRCSIIGNTQRGVWAAAFDVIEDNQIVDNGSSGATFQGIYIYDGDTTVRNNNILTPNGRDILTLPGVRATIIDNTLSTCTSITVGGGAAVFAPLQGQVHSNVTHTTGYCP